MTLIPSPGGIPAVGFWYRRFAVVLESPLKSSSPSGVTCPDRAPPPGVQRGRWRGMLGRMVPAGWCEKCFDFPRQEVMTLSIRRGATTVAWMFPIRSRTSTPR